MSSEPAIVGTGWAVPSHIRTNDDPIFDWLKKNYPHGSELFTGYKERRVLGPDEGMQSITVPAARHAIEMSGIDPRDIDLVLGTASVSKYQTPDEIAHLPALLGLSPSAWVIPSTNDFSNYASGLVIADAMIRAGRAKHALIVCTSNWTRYVDYHTPQSVSASDGAAATVVSAHKRKPAFSVVDTTTTTEAKYYGTMFMRGEEVYVQGISDPLYTHATFHITDAGQEGFKVFGENEPPKVAKRVMERHGLKGSDVSLITHQASAVLMDAWQKAIQPAQYLQTLEKFANLTVANIALDVAYFHDQIEKDHLVLLSIGAEMHTNATLLRRH